jgi:hypothetical protein
MTQTRHVHSREYRGKYVEAYGAGPYECFFCDDELLTLEEVHHIDGNRNNNEPYNLAAAHDACHNSYHHTGLKHTDDTKDRISASLVEAYASGRHSKTDARGEKNPFFGKHHTDVALEKMRGPRGPSPFRGKKRPPEVGAKVSAAKKGVPLKKVPCSKCGQLVGINWITRHEARCTC